MCCDSLAFCMVFRNETHPPICHSTNALPFGTSHRTARSRPGPGFGAPSHLRCTGARRSETAAAGSTPTLLIHVLVPSPNDPSPRLLNRRDSTTDAGRADNVDRDTLRRCGPHDLAVQHFLALPPRRGRRGRRGRARVAGAAGAQAGVRVRRAHGRPLGRGARGAVGRDGHVGPRVDRPGIADEGQA